MAKPTKQTGARGASRRRKKEGASLNSGAIVRFISDVGSRIFFTPVGGKKRILLLESSYITRYRKWAKGRAIMSFENQKKSKPKKIVSIVLIVPSRVTSTATIRDKASTTHTYDNAFSTHITLAYKPSSEALSFFKDKIGKEVKVAFGELVYDQNCICYEVDILSTLKYYWGESRPHLTVGTSGDTPPSYSNLLINDKSSTRSGVLSGGSTATCRVAALVYGKSGKEYRTSIHGLKI